MSTSEVFLRRFFEGDQHATTRHARGTLRLIIYGLEVCRAEMAHPGSSFQVLREFYEDMFDPDNPSLNLEDGVEALHSIMDKVHRLMRSSRTYIRRAKSVLALTDDDEDEDVRAELVIMELDRGRDLLELYRAQMAHLDYLLDPAMEGDDGYYTTEEVIAADRRFPEVTNMAN